LLPRRQPEVVPEAFVSARFEQHVLNFFESLVDGHVKGSVQLKVGGDVGVCAGPKKNPDNFVFAEEGGVGEHGVALSVLDVNHLGILLDKALDAAVLVLLNQLAQVLLVDHLLDVVLAGNRIRNSQGFFLEVVDHPQKKEILHNLSHDVLQTLHSRQAAAVDRHVPNIRGFPNHFQFFIDLIEVNLHRSYFRFKNKFLGFQHGAKQFFLANLDRGFLSVDNIFTEFVERKIAFRGNNFDDGLSTYLVRDSTGAVLE